jgi:hypothetical protein
MNTRKIFDVWQELANGGESFRPAYYDDIICNLKLEMFDKDGKVSRTYIFEECFPVSINPSQLGWDQDNSILTIPIEIAYWKWRAIETETSVNS